MTNWDINFVTHTRAAVREALTNLIPESARVAKITDELVALLPFRDPKHASYEVTVKGNDDPRAFSLVIGIQTHAKSK